MSAEAEPDFSRYVRQMRYAPIGEAGQQRLQDSRVLICGCGALGSVVANTLARAGVGHLRIVDRDFVDLSNLQRQVLYDEADVEALRPKAIAAAAKLRAINSGICIEPIVADIDSSNILELCRDIDLILDGTDNFETRFLINDAAAQLGLPWVFGGCVGAEGQVLAILPGGPPCLRCLMPEPPPADSLPTCDSAGVIASIVQIVASMQACEAIKLLVGDLASLSRELVLVDLWKNSTRRIRLDQLRNGAGCPTCRREEFPWLAGTRTSQTAVLCGRNAVQISAAGIDRTDGKISLETLAERLNGVGTVTRTPYLLRLAVGEYLLTIFPDGRAIIGGTEDPVVARTLYARYAGG
ncbi:MAG: ThiF family adenylyltransferase [Planctomycetota bacterium]|nr:ThiF family adenylyltransferase [Planctomycetota bacterium]